MQFVQRGRFASPPQLLLSCKNDPSNFDDKLSNCLADLSPNDLLLLNTTPFSSNDDVGSSLDDELQASSLSSSTFMMMSGDRAESEGVLTNTLSDAHRWSKLLDGDGPSEPPASPLPLLEAAVMAKRSSAAPAGGPATGDRQTGQLLCAENHWSIHGTWNACRQAGNKRTASQSASSPKHTAHSLWSTRKSRFPLEE